MLTTNDKSIELVTIEVKLNAQQVRLINTIIENLNEHHDANTNQTEFFAKATNHYLRHLGFDMK
jgi:hypothetical protein